MEKTITLRELVNAYLGLQRLGERDGIKAAPSWWIASTLKEWRPKYETYIEKRQSLFEKHGERAKVENSGQEMWTIPVGHETAYNEEHIPFVDQVVHINVTTHSLAWVGETIAKAIEPDTLKKLSFVLETSRDKAVSKTNLTRREVEEANLALASIATYRMDEALAWWFASIFIQTERITDETALQRQALIDALCKIDGNARTTTPEYRRANEELIAQEVELFFESRPFADLGELVEKWTPTMLAPVLFLFTEPAEG